MRALVLYVGLLVVAALVGWGVLSAGHGLAAQGLSPDALTSGSGAHGAQSAGIGQIALALAVVVAAARGAGMLAQRALGQPPVVGEIAAGILLGPSLLRGVAPDIAEALVPLSTLPALGTLAQLGVVLFMALVGVELDPRALSGRARETLAVSHAGIVVPFTLGGSAALWLYPRLGVPGTDFTAFALFCGAALSVTAFPVLARILADQGLTRTPLGVTAIACAAADDVTAWALLAGVVALTRADSGALLVTLGGVAAFGAFVWFGLRRALAWLEGHGALSDTSRFAGFLGLALVSAWATELAGVHALFGAFVAGAFVPADGRLAQAVTTRLRDLVGVLLLPTFFVVTGLRTDVGSLNGADDLRALGVLLSVAVLGKLGGTWLAGLWVGMSSRFAASLGLLMNTRGLMGLVVLDVGLSMGLLSPRLFTLFVLVALLTTAMTGPLLRRLSPAASAEDALR